MNTKKIAGMVLMAGVGFTLLTGCGGGNSSSTNAGNSKNEITFWNPFVGADGENLKKMVDEYNKTDPEFKIKNVSLKESDMYTKIPTVVNSGRNIPDLNIVHAERIKQYKDNDMLVTFDDVLKDFPDIKDENYVPEAWNLGEIDGARYSVPLDIHNYGIYYNKELLDKYLPTALDDNIITFDEIEEIGKKAENDDIRGLGITWIKPNFLSLFAQEGGELSQDGTAPTLDTDATKKAIQRYADMYKENITTREGEDPAQLFLAGKLVLNPDGIWMRNQVKEAKFEWGLTNSPQLSNDLSKAVNWASSHQFVMFKNKDRSEEKTKGIMEFLDWVRTNSLEWAKAGQNPATLDLLDNSEYTDMEQSLFVNTPEELATLKIFDYKYNGFVAEYLDAHALDVIFGKMSVDDFASGMQKEVADKIAKDNSNN
ncbi:extracellular solute-binding protein [Enterococcus faecalis]|uniref:extracellular solute-binding protein n=1 Tax=Enterococcus faecalis TaxID=1351 RepID=UPI00164F10F8|nr:extracellular solute-binding protein [Enterococcus faecalis]EGO8741002.1 extracellular solute-binding protein [Enterococcus faecalis]